MKNDKDKPHVALEVNTLLERSQQVKQNLDKILQILQEKNKLIEVEPEQTSSPFKSSR